MIRRLLALLRPFKARRARPDAPQPLSSAVWEWLETQPGFNEELRQAEADLRAGKGTPVDELRRRGLL